MAARAGQDGSGDMVPVSALTGDGVAALTARVAAVIAGGATLHEIALHPSDGARLAWLHSHGEVVSRDEADGSIQVRVRLSAAERARFDTL